MQNISSPKLTLSKRIPALLIITQLCMFAVFSCCLQHRNHITVLMYIYTIQSPPCLIYVNEHFKRIFDWQGWCYWYNLLLQKTS